MYKCMNCGREYDGEFCPDCGTKRGGKKCVYCGAVNAADDKFCRTCGTKLENTPGDFRGDTITSDTKINTGVQFELIKNIKSSVRNEIIVLSLMLALVIISAFFLMIFSAIHDVGINNIPANESGESNTMIMSSTSNLLMYRMILIMIIYLPCFILNLVALIRCAKSRRALKPAVLPAIFVTVSTSIILCSVTFYVGFALSERWLYNIIIHLVTTILTCFMWKAWANANFYYKELIAYCSK